MIIDHQTIWPSDHLIIDHQTISSFLFIFPVFCDPMQADETGDRRYMPPNVFAGSANRSNTDHSQKVNRNTLCPLPCTLCCCLCPDLAPGNSISSKLKMKPFLNFPQNPIQICQRGHSLVVINCLLGEKRCMTNFHWGATQQWCSISRKVPRIFDHGFQAIKKKKANQLNIIFQYVKILCRYAEWMLNWN